MNSSGRLNTFSLAILFFILIASASSCKKEDKDSLATVSISSITDITSSTVKIYINVSDDGGATVTAAGICWSKNPNPDLSSGFQSVGQGTGEFISVLTGLDPNTVYYIRAFATNGVGTAYSSSNTFVTLP